jgi:hypothetical protein
MVNQHDMEPSNEVSRGEKEGGQNAPENISGDSTIVSTASGSVRKKVSNRDLTTDGAPDAAPDTTVEKEGEPDASSSEDDEVVYQKGLPLLIICVGLSLAVFLVALVSRNLFLPV